MSSSMHWFARIFSRWGFSREGGSTRAGSVLLEESILGEQLQREALAERPQFSADLHQRICHAVRHADPHATLEPAIVRHHDAGLKLAWLSFHRRIWANRMRIAWGSLAVAGALVFAGWVVRLDGWWTWASVPESNVARRADLAGRAGDPATSLATLAALPDQATERIEQWLVSTMDNRQWAYLGHDVRLVTQWLVEDLPWKIPAGDAEPDGSESSS